MITFHIATAQGCNIQTFYGTAVAFNSDIQNARYKLSWIKPIGVSHVYMMLIGGGGDGNGTDSGGSGAVTVWYGAAQHVPNKLDVFARGPDDAAYHTTVSYTTTNATPYVLLTAEAADTGGIGGGASTANSFAASGFYQSVAGQNGFAGANTPSATTFLSAGTGNDSGNSSANYGYIANDTGTNGKGYFQLQPIIVGVGSAGNDNFAVGCGAGDNSGNVGGQGMVLIASW